MTSCHYSQINISSPWNYKVLSDIFVKIELFTYSYSVKTYLHYVIDFFLMLCKFWDFLFKKQKRFIYTVEWNAKTLKLNISKLLGMQIEPYNSKGTISFYNYPTFVVFLSVSGIILTGLNNN